MREPIEGKKVVVLDVKIWHEQEELLYQFTVEDPTFYTEPWSGEFSFYWFDGNTYEFSCHEGNYALPGKLRGGQMEVARLAAEKSKSN